MGRHIIPVLAAALWCTNPAWAAEPAATPEAPVTAAQPATPNSEPMPTTVPDVDTQAELWAANADWALGRYTSAAVHCMRVFEHTGDRALLLRSGVAFLAVGTPQAKTEAVHIFTRYRDGATTDAERQTAALWLERAARGWQPPPPAGAQPAPVATKPAPERRTRTELLVPGLVGIALGAGGIIGGVVLKGDDGNMCGDSAKAKEVETDCTSAGDLIGGVALIAGGSVFAAVGLVLTISGAAGETVEPEVPEIAVGPTGGALTWRF